MESLAEAREYLEANKDKGAHCPACDQLVKEYKRSVYASVAQRLIWLYNLSNGKATGEYFHVTKIYEASETYITGDFCLSARFGLIEEMPENENPATKTSGFWRITELGCAFVRGEVTIPKYVHLYNGETRGFSGKDITIKQALGKHFNYQELMSR